MNSPPLFRLDTHAVYWRRTASPRLSAAAAQVFEDGVHGKAILMVPHGLIAELFPPKRNAFGKAGDRHGEEETRSAPAHL